MTKRSKKRRVVSRSRRKISHRRGYVSRRVAACRRVRRVRRVIRKHIPRRVKTRRVRTRPVRKVVRRVERKRSRPVLRRKKQVFRSKGGWMRVVDYLKLYKSKFPPKYRKHFSMGQSSLPDPKAFVHVSSGFVSERPKFPRRLAGNIQQYYSGWYHRSGGKPYKAEKKTVVRDKRGRKRTVKRVVEVKPEPVKRTTVERVKVGITRKGKQVYFDPRKLMSKRLMKVMLKYISSQYGIQRTSRTGSDEIFIPLQLLFWEFAGN